MNHHRDQSQPKPALEVVATITFDESHGQTTLTIRSLFESPTLRDAFLKMRMAQGWSQSLERLQAVVTK